VSKEDKAIWAVVSLLSSAGLNIVKVNRAFGSGKNARLEMRYELQEGSLHCDVLLREGGDLLLPCRKASVHLSDPRAISMFKSWLDAFCVPLRLGRSEACEGCPASLAEGAAVPLTGLAKWLERKSAALVDEARRELEAAGRRECGAAAEVREFLDGLRKEGRS
jgi:hypothetical protein